MTMISMEGIANAWTATGRAAVQRLFFDRQAEFWMGELDPLRSLTEIRARVVEVVEETEDTKTFVLQPNAAWRGHRAGQHASVEVEVNGVRVRRCYSISSRPGEALVSITVKRVPGGRVSAWLHEHTRSGDILRLGAAAGDFVLPGATPAKLLLLSGGSGITPVMSMLRDLGAHDALDDVVFVHYARSRADVIFGEELAATPDCVLSCASTTSRRRRVDSKRCALPVSSPTSRSARPSCAVLGRSWIAPSGFGRVSTHRTACNARASRRHPR